VPGVDVDSAFGGGQSALCNAQLRLIQA